MTTVWKWAYNPVSATISGSSAVLVTGMSNVGHTTRTLSIPKNNIDLLVVSCGSNANLDMDSVKVETGRAIVKVFNLTSVPSGGIIMLLEATQPGMDYEMRLGLCLTGITSG
jgi:hypothetical protein